MIYQLELPKLTLKRLTDVVYLQMEFLNYASSKPLLDQQSCQDYFSKHPKFSGRQEKIAKWLWNGKRSKLLNHLAQFAQGSPDEKSDWTRKLSNEALIFLQNPVGFIAPQNEVRVPDWQNAGAAFLRKFYSDYLGRGSGKFPEYFFSGKGAKKFGRQEFLSEFKNLNKIFQCPACDIEPYTRIDHYLPQGLYPQLACHPYNLVPTCNSCNSDYKGEINLLIRKSGTQRSLENVFLPYRGYGFRTDAYLKITLKKGYRCPIIIGFKPQQGKSLCERVETYRDLFSIPERWRKETAQIESLVYSQIQKRIQAHIDVTRSKRPDLDIFALRDLLDGLLGELFKEQGNEAWRFPMTWCLVTLINQEVKPAIHSSTPINLDNYALLRDIASDFNLDTILHPVHERSETAKNLCDIAAGEA